MAITLTIPAPVHLEQVIGTLRTWRREEGPFHLHPGDLGWHHLRGAEATAAHLRLWRRDDQLVAVGLLDGADLLRTAVEPALAADEELARTLAESLAEPEHGVLPEGQVYVEAHSALGLRTGLLRRGWSEGEPWFPLCRDLTAPVEEPGLLIEQVGVGRPGLLEPMACTRTTASAATDVRSAVPPPPSCAAWVPRAHWCAPRGPGGRRGDVPRGRLHAACRGPGPAAPRDDLTPRRRPETLPQAVPHPLSPPVSVRVAPATESPPSPHCHWAISGASSPCS